MSDQIDVNQLSNALQQKIDLPSGKSQADIDYVVEWQAPTSENNYTWYRLYKSGWIEQGGYGDIGSSQQSPNITVVFPVEMANIYYNINIININEMNTNYKQTQGVSSHSTTGMTFGFYSANDYCRYYSWEVRGMSAQS